MGGHSAPDAAYLGHVRVLPKPPPLLGVSYVSQAVLTGWKAFVAEQKEHGAPAMFWGDDGYIWEFLKQTFENWQSEFLQLLAMVVLTAFLIHKGSAESRDQTDRMERKIDEIKRAFERSK